MIETDVLVVGAGPAGLATSIALRRKGFKGRIIVLDKGRAVGSHVLSGAVFDPSGFKGLLTEDEIATLPFEANVTRESFRFCFSNGLSVKVPWVPPMMRSKGYPLGSLTKLTRYLAKIAADEGVEICTGFAVTSLVMRDGAVVGAMTGEKGLTAKGTHKSNYLAAEEIRAKTTVLAEGAGGVLTEKLIAELHLASETPQAYALGIKELVELPEKRDGGVIMHTFGYPVDMWTYGGGFVYHVSDTKVMVGYAVGLDYRDMAIGPYELFSRFKASSAVAPHIRGGKTVAYGAKLIPEGGFYALPKVCAPGVLIVGDGGGLVDGLRIKGVHIALQSGMAAAEAIVSGKPERYEELLRATPGYGEVKRVKNVHGGFSICAPVGVMMAGFAWATRGWFPFWQVGNGKGHPAAHGGKPVAHGEPSSALLSSLFLSGVLHDEDQPCHLKILDKAICEECERRYGSPCTRFCPAGVYRREGDGLAIEFSNCLHCKTCRYRCPYGNVDWTFPQGGDGPRYTQL